VSMHIIVVCSLKMQGTEQMEKFFLYITMHRICREGRPERSEVEFFKIQEGAAGDVNLLF
jgi:hypothetical protein